MVAYHFEPQTSVDIPGLGILCRQEDYLGGAGQYRNSIDRESTYAMVGAQPWRLAGVRLGAFAGIVNGYQRTIVPMAALAASAPVPFGELHFSLMLMVPNWTPTTLSLSISVKW